MTGCFGTRHLEDDQKRPFRLHILAQHVFPRPELKGQLVQETNGNLWFAPSSIPIGAYYLGKSPLFYNKERIRNRRTRAENKFDKKIAATKKQSKLNNLEYRKQQKLNKLDNKVTNGNTLMQWGQPVYHYDSSKVKQSIEQLQDHLFTQGYFDAKATSEVEPTKGFWGLFTNKLVNVTYRIKPGKPYKLDSIFYQIDDPAVDSVIMVHKSDALIKKGQVYNEENLSNERDRMDLLLKDNGYYDFSKQYIEYNVDTTLIGHHKVALMIKINNPDNEDHHHIFRVDSVSFTADASKTQPGKKRENIDYRNIDYRFYKENRYNPKILSQRVFIYPGQRYSRTRTFNTQKQLANLDEFKFVNINYDTSGGRFITNIFTSPLSRYEWSNELGVNVTEGYPGPFYNINLKKRNIFRGLENFDFNGRIGFEGVASATESQNVYRSIEGSVNATITFPQFIFPLSQAAEIRYGSYNPRTKAQLGYTYTDRPEYIRSNANVSFTYLWDTRRTTQLFLTLTNLNIINTPFKSAEFETLLQEQEANGNLSLASSFRPSLVSSMIFGVTWSHGNYGNKETNSSYIRAQVESGGTSLNLLNTESITNQGLEYFKYLRFSFDFRRNIVFNKHSIFAYRFNSGLAYPYSNNKTLPYEKFFFAGGSSSIRAWRPRRLGPGSLPPPLSADPVKDGYYNYSFESPGEILMESSAEFRQDIIGIFEGAVFVDAGNVWWFEELPRPDGLDYGSSKFRFNDFYKQFGVGTGFGFRLDFTFLILRFDVGIKVYDPARPTGQRFVLDDMRFFKPFSVTKEPVIYNVAIGYPF